MDIPLCDIKGKHLGVPVREPFQANTALLIGRR